MTFPPFLYPLLLTYLLVLVFFWMFLPHRYSKAVSFGIMLASFAAAGILEYVICRHIARPIDRIGCAALAGVIVLALVTSLIFGEHRDVRTVFMALSACTFSIAALIVECLAYFFTKESLFSMLCQVLFSACVLFVMARHNQKTPITALLAGSKGRWRLCLIPSISFLSIFASGIWPGNLYLIPACRPITVIMLVLMFLYYELVIALLRMQRNNSWLNSNNELLDAYSHGLKLEIEETGKKREELAILRHDIRHRANLVLYYLNEGNTDAIRALCAEVNAQLDATVQAQYCEDTALNWILDSSARKARERGVQFSCEAEIPTLPEKWKWNSEPSC